VERLQWLIGAQTGPATALCARPITRQHSTSAVQRKNNVTFARSSIWRREATATKPAMSLKQIDTHNTDEDDIELLQLYVDL